MRAGRNALGDEDDNGEDLICSDDEKYGGMGTPQCTAMATTMKTTIDDNDDDNHNEDRNADDILCKTK